MLKLICFDLDNTLWPMDGVIQKAEQALLDKLYEITQLSIQAKTLREAKKTFMQANPTIAHDPTLVRTTFLNQFLHANGLTEKQSKEVTSTLMQTFLQHRNEVTLFDGAESVLAQLKNQYQLSSLTNGNACLNTIGLAKYFNYKVSPEIAGTKKPNIKIFEYLIQKANIKPNEILHIGDHWEDDIVGAQTAGMHALWINPKLDPWPGPTEFSPKGIISSIHEAPQYINNFED